tara:strand:- start:2399 stop:2842 length:444 start_codon:yes stop_codon:yes gene_type:complete
MIIPVKLYADEAFAVPTYQTDGSAGVDLYSTQEQEFKFGQRALLGTGLYIALPAGYEAQIRTRSGLAIKRGLVVLNSPGTIDSDYRGEIKVPIINMSQSPEKIEVGERIAQMIIAAHSRAEFEVVPTKEALGQTARGEGGFGSTGTR